MHEKPRNPPSEPVGAFAPHPCLTRSTADAALTPMSGLRHVQFYDNDTLLWSNNGSYSPTSSQFVIAIFSQGLSIIDYVAHTSVSVFYAT